MEKYSTFRLDDITPDMKWDNFIKIKNIFDKYGIKPLIGVVPNNRDKFLHHEELRDDFWQLIRELRSKGWVVAQHGYEHVYENEESGILKLNPYSEFAGVEYENQLDKIKKGKVILEENGIPVKIFMAPGHTYDKNTLLALKENGFEYVTDGYAKMPYIWKGLKFYPCRSSSFKILSGCNTICLHTNTMQDKNFEELEQFICSNRTQLVSYGDMLEMVPAVKRTIIISVTEQLNLAGFKLKRWIGRTQGIQKYMQITDKGNTVIKTGLRLVCLPYCAVLLLCEMWKGK